MPGLGQLLHGRRQAAKVFGIPFLVLAAVLLVFVLTRSPARLFATVVSPAVMGFLLSLNIVVLVWRLAAALHAFFDGRYAGRPGRVGAAGLAIVLTATVFPHGIANAWGSQAQDTFRQIFAGERS
ncbi:MAG TPA: hypothetical protein VJS45_05355, partial [Acidimicrobiia bacterium]|nr:hypothetical protein [Acidimicrobiia bacterium]